MHGDKHVRPQGEDGIHTPGRKASGDASPVNAWTWGGQPPACHLNHPVLRCLLWLPKLTEECRGLWDT